MAMVGEGLTRSSVRATSPISISWKMLQCSAGSGRTLSKAAIARKPYGAKSHRRGT
jgi:hypothetical protein